MPKTDFARGRILDSNFNLKQRQMVQFYFLDQVYSIRISSEDRMQNEFFLSLPLFAQRRPDCDERTATVETAELN